MRPILAACLLPLALAAGAGEAPDAVADALLKALSEARAEGGLPVLRRDPQLDAAALARARATARLPERERLGEKVPIDRLLREAGRRRFARATQYLAYEGGYADEADAAIRNWKAYRSGWDQAMEGSWREVGAATARAEDGTLVIVVVFVEPAGPIGSPESIEAAIVAGINVERGKHGMAPLAPDPRLAPVARAHSEDMLRRRYFDHVSPDGARAADRVGAAGIAFRRVGENILESERAEDPVASAIRNWMGSPGHRANILDAAYTHTGVGVAVDADEGKIVYTQLFLRPPGIEAPPAPERR